MLIRELRVDDMKIYVKINSLKNRLYNWLYSIKTDIFDLLYLKKSFIIIFFTYIIFYFLLFAINITYIDDILKNVGIGNFTLTYYGGWVFDDILFFIFSAGRKFVDSSPIGQLFALLLFALSSTILIYIFYEKKNTNIFAITSSMVLGLTFSALSLISQKYDAPYYAFAVFTSLIPFIFYKKDNIKYVFLSTIFLSISFMSYHSTSGIYPVVVLFLTLNMFIRGCDKKKIIRFIQTSLISFVIALVIYGIVLNFCSFAKERLEASVDSNFILNLLTSYKNIFKYIYITDLANIKFFVFAFLLYFIIFNLYASKHNKLLTFIVIIFLLAIVFIVQFGYSPLTKDMARDYVNSHRYIYGYSVTLAIIMISCLNYNYKLNISHFLSLILVLYLGIACILYGFAHFKQREYNISFMSKVAKSISEMNIINDNSETGIYVQGRIDYIPEVKAIFDVFPSFKILIDCGYMEEWPYPVFISYFYDKHQVKVKIKKNNDSNYYSLNEKDFKLYKDFGLYRILTDNKEILIEIK